MHAPRIAGLSTAARDSKHRRVDHELYWPNLELYYLPRMSGGFLATNASSRGQIPECVGNLRSK